MPEEDIPGKHKEVAPGRPPTADGWPLAEVWGETPECSSLAETRQEALWMASSLIYTFVLMGRQTRFHMLPEDCRRFVLFLRERDPMIVTEWYSAESPKIQEIGCPWERGGHFCLWNQAILPNLERQASGKYFNIDSGLPVIEFSYAPPVLELWNGQPALLQGRIWASFESRNETFKTWYNDVVRWIRKNFIRDLAVGLDRDSIGPAAYEWFKRGGLLLPSFRPPINDDWLAWTNVQNQHRAELIST